MNAWLDATMPNFKCVLCGSHSTRLLFVKDSYPIVRCRKCGLIYLPSEYVQRADLRQLYGDGYFQGGIYANYLAERKFRLKLFAEKYSLIRKFLPETGKLLDVGCAAGYFLEVARAMGYDAFGVELSKYAAAHISKSLSGHVFAGELEDAGFESNHFDVVTMWDVLEHLPKPRETLQEAFRILRPHGAICVETVNTACLNAKLLGQGWPLYAPPYHLFHFSLDNLREILRICGFRLVAIEPIQTYSPIHRHRAVRYFKALRGPLGSSFVKTFLREFFADVVLAIAQKPD